MEKLKKITAVIPVYNVQDYLEQCLDSICNQTEQFDEVILVNDGSTDNSLQICEKYCNKYRNIRLINQKNEGVAEARNVGISATKGEYIVFIDSDDYIMDNMVQVLKREIAEMSYDVLFFGASVKCELSNREPETYYIRDNSLCEMDMNGVEFFVKSFPTNYIVSPCLAIYRREFLEDNKLCFEKGIYFEDNDFCLRVCMKAKKVKVINKNLYIRRYHSGSIMTGTISSKKCEDLIRVNELIWEALEQSELDIKYKIKLVSYYLIYTWGVISEAEYFIEIREKWNNLVKLFFQKWKEHFVLKEEGLEEMLALYLMTMQYNNSAGTKKKMDNLKDRIIMVIKERLGKIPLECSNSTVGIYGTGKHTKYLIQLYETYIGDIKSKLVFIVTEKKEDAEMYQGKPLILCKEIETDINYIIISSLKYQKDMLETLKKYRISEDRIIKLYDKDDYCDLVSVARILK